MNRGLLMLRLLPLVLIALAVPSTAAAVPILYAVRLVDGSGGVVFEDGSAVANDAGFAPGATVPLTDLSLTFGGGSAFQIDWRIADCEGTPTGQVDGAGADLASVDARCTAAPVGDFTIPHELELNPDGTFVMGIIPAIVVVAGTYTVERIAVPAPGPVVLLASAAGLCLLVRRRPSP